MQRKDQREGLPTGSSLCCLSSVPIHCPSLTHGIPPTPHICLGARRSSPPLGPPHPHLLLLHSKPTWPRPLRVPSKSHLPVQSARISPSPRQVADLPARLPRRALRSRRAPRSRMAWAAEAGRLLPGAGTGRSAGARRNEGPASAASGQPVEEGRPRRKRTSCQGSTAAWEEMGPINPHLPLQIGVQAERWKN